MHEINSLRTVLKSNFLWTFYIFVKQTQMELKPFDNIIQFFFFCYISRSFGLQKYNNNP